MSNLAGVSTNLFEPRIITVLAFMKMKLFPNDSIFLEPIPWPKLKKRIDSLQRRNVRFIAKVQAQNLRLEAKAQTEQRTSDTNCKDIPGNATIRKEYVRCGKEDCDKCKHGPYYYAYWKENRKLRTKYIGKYLSTASDTKHEHKFEL